jgi:MOSC domain-containing protein
MIMKMHVAELWRYPVKSLAGERLNVAEISADGIPWDRVVQVYDADGRIVTARTAPRLLRLRGTLGPTGETLVNGRPWTAPEVTAAIEAAAGAGARLARDDGPDRFDVLPLLVTTDGAVNALGLDRRRFRPNILVAGVNGLAEREWPGRRARIGDAIIGFKKLRGRCVMTTYDPDTLEHDPTVLRRIVQEMGGRLALDSYVVRGGRVAVGDPVELL